MSAYDILVLRRAMKDRRPPVVIKRCARCNAEFAQHTYGPGRKYCGPECRRLARKEARP